MAGILLEGENVSEEDRAGHARALAAEKQAEALRRNAARRGPADEQALSRAGTVEGEVLEDRVIAAGSHYAGPVRAGEHMRIVDLEGQQAVDFLCYDLDDKANRYNAANTIKLNRSIYVEKGFRLYSDRADVLMTIIEDTVGYHDTIGGCCSAETNRLRYGIMDTPNCRSNFVAALAPHGLDSRDIPANLNFFMYVPVLDDGSTEITEGRSKPGDFVDLVADRDVLVAISNCPQIYNPCNGWNPTPVRLIRWR
jgi:hypothetical protein